MSRSDLLVGLSVVDLGVGKAAALAAKFLADSGASVTRIVDADPFEAIYPAYKVWRAGAAKAGADELEALLARADVCIVGGEDHPDIERRRDAAAIAARHPRVVVLDITDGPAGSEFVGPSTELLAQVRSGLAMEQLPDRPIVNAFDPGAYGAALHGLIGVLGALFEREASKQGQLVTTSLFEGALAWVGTYWSLIEKPSLAAAFVVPRGVSPLIFKAKDGVYIHLAIGGAGSKYGFYQALGIDDPTVKPSDSGMPKPGGSPRDFFGDYDLLAAHVAKLDSVDLLERCWARGLPAEPVQAPGRCWDEPQIVRNGIISILPDGTRCVGVPYLARPLGEGAPKRARAGAHAPLEGVRVVDCGAFVAGPLVGSILSDLGADVIKVEAKQGDPNRSIFKSFGIANRGKRAISVDMKDVDGASVVEALCRGADVVMNNFRPGVSARLGVDPDSLTKLNSSLIVLEAPAYGSEGPLALKSGFDMVMQAWCGHEEKAAGRGNEPRWNRTNLVDIAAGMLGAVAALSALLHRERTGQAVALETPLANAGIFTLAELIQHPDGRFEGVPQLSSTLGGHHPAECLYKAKDGWVAIVARGERTALALREALGLTQALSGKVEDWSEAEESAISEKVAKLEAAALVALLSPHKIWVERCIDDKESKILNDAALIARGTVRVTRHAQFGQINELGAMCALSRFRAGNGLPAPTPGAHTRELLAQVGYDEAAIAVLFERGTVI